MTSITDENRRAVLAAIAKGESRPDSGATNESIEGATGLDSVTVASILRELWRTAQIEGLLGLGGERPSLTGIRRVLPGRVRVWESDGWYVEQPAP